MLVYMNKRSLRFHVRSNDLFGTVATVVDLVRQEAEKSGYRKVHSRAREFAEWYGSFREVRKQLEQRRNPWLMRGLRVAIVL
jgi:hypothetical protein